jgi:hypothetical protein
MIIEIIEAAIGSFTVLVCAGLYVANSIDKRLYGDKYIEDNNSTVKILPNLGTITLDTRCPICYDNGSCHGSKCQEYGLTIARICNEDPPNKCPAFMQVHLHVVCRSCGSIIFMAPRNS